MENRYHTWNFRFRMCQDGRYFGGANVPNEDWIITPAMNFDLYTNEVFSFMSA